MSAQRPAAGVRNLRAMFENPEAATSSSPEPRGRSPASADDNNSRPTSKVRASFVSVDPSGSFLRDLNTARSTSRPSQPPSPTKQRRESFGLRKTEDTGVASRWKVNMSQDAPTKAAVAADKSETSKSNASINGSWNAAALPNFTSSTTEAPPPVTLEKPVEDTPKPSAGAPKPSNPPPVAAPPAEVEAPTVNPDKPTSVGEDATATMKPSDPTDAAAVSGGEALAGAQEDVPPLLTATPAAKPAAAPKTNGSAASAAKKPAPVTTSKAATTAPKSTAKSTSAAKPSSSTVKSPVSSSVTSPTSTTAKPATTAPKPTKTAETKPPRQSLASSASSLSSTTTKSKPRSPTRPVKLPSHLTAPTASSAAKRDDASSTAGLTKKPSVTGRDRTSGASVVSKAAPAKKPAPRQSLPVQPKRPESRSGNAAPPDSGFLARMMRPTASSANKTHEKVEVKSPPRGKPAPAAKPKEKVASLASKAKAKLEDAAEAVKPNKEDASENKSAQDGQATPDVTSADLIAETPKFEGTTIR